MSAPAKKEKTNVDVLFENIWFYLIFFLCLLLIASFGIIAEA
jgi:hypothetical protein